MKTGILILAGVLLAGPAVADQTVQTATLGDMVVTGEVVRFEPGRLLVVRASDGRETTFSLTPAVTVPAEVQVGRTVSVHSEQGAGGVASVKRVTTTSVSSEGQLKQTTEETTTSASGMEKKTTTTTVTGNVVSYVPGRTIVVRNATGESVSFELAPSAVVPAEVQVGKKVTLYTMPGQQGGTAVVSRITTTSVTPEGDMKSTTEETRREPSGATTTTTTTTVHGKVQTYLPGKSITVIKSDGSAVTFTVPEGARVPPDIAVGRTVTLSLRPNGTIVETIVIQKPE